MSGPASSNVAEETFAFPPTERDAAVLAAMRGFLFSDRFDHRGQLIVGFSRFFIRVTGAKDTNPTFKFVDGIWSFRLSRRHGNKIRVCAIDVAEKILRCNLLAKGVVARYVTLEEFDRRIDEIKREAAVHIEKKKLTWIDHELNALVKDADWLIDDIPQPNEPQEVEQTTRSPPPAPPINSVESGIPPAPAQPPPLYSVFGRGSAVVPPLNIFSATPDSPVFNRQYQEDNPQNFFASSSAAAVARAPSPQPPVETRVLTRPKTAAPGGEVTPKPKPVARRGILPESFAAKILREETEKLDIQMSEASKKRKRLKVAADAATYAAEHGEEALADAIMKLVSSEIESQ